MCNLYNSCFTNRCGYTCGNAFGCWGSQRCGNTWQNTAQTNTCCCGGTTGNTTQNNNGNTQNGFGCFLVYGRIVNPCGGFQTATQTGDSYYARQYGGCRSNCCGGAYQND